MSFNIYQPKDGNNVYHINQAHIITNPPQSHPHQVVFSTKHYPLQNKPLNNHQSSSIYQNLPSPHTIYAQNRLSTNQCEQANKNINYGNISTVKSMIHSAPDKLQVPQFQPTKLFGGINKLSSMARTVTTKFDDSKDLQNGKFQNPHTNLKQNQEEKLKNHHNSNFLNNEININKSFIDPKLQTDESYFNQIKNKNITFKSFIHDNSSSQFKIQNIHHLKTPKHNNQQQQLKNFRDVNNFKRNDLNTHSNQSIQSVHTFKDPRSLSSQNLQSEHINGRILHQNSAPVFNNLQGNMVKRQMKTFLNVPNHSKVQNIAQNHKVITQNSIKNIANHHNPTYSTTSSSQQLRTNNSYFTNNQKTLSPNQQINHISFYKNIADYKDKKNISPQNSGHKQQQKAPFFIKKNEFEFGKNQKSESSMMSVFSTQANTPVKQSFNTNPPSFFKKRQNDLIVGQNRRQPCSQEIQKIKIQTQSKPTILSSQDNPVKQQKPIPKITPASKARHHTSMQCRSLQFSFRLAMQMSKIWSIDDFQLGDKLGKGAFGDVYIARQKEIGFMCVLKKMSKKRIKQLQRQQHVIRQIKIQMYLNHNHLTAMYGYFHDKQNIYLILEYLPDGNLFQLKRRKKTSQKQTATIIKQLCQALSYMHNRNVIHRDIKPENIFVSEGYVKLGDFGCSISCDGLRRTVVSCLQYSSPQQLNNEYYNEKIDVWGVGILAYELLTGKSPFQGMIVNLTQQSQKADFSSLCFPTDQHISDNAKNFITSLLNIDPVNRLDIDEALQHEFILANANQTQKII